MIVVGIALGFSLLYFLLQIRYLYFWNKTPALSAPVDHTAETGVTIIIVAHNEEKSIGRCLKGLLVQQYPSHLMEIIIIDDHSTDDMLNVISQIGSPLISVYSLKD